MTTVTPPARSNRLSTRARARRRIFAVAVILALASTVLFSATPGNATPPNVQPDLTVETWVPDVGIPWDISFTPDGHALIPLRDARQIVVRFPNGDVATVEANLSDVNTVGEGGLMGLVVDPDFDQNRRFYTCQTTSAAVEVVSWRMNASYTRATRIKDPLVGGIDRTTGRHSGCRLRFGYEGYLWIATGDAARGSTPQNLRSLAGKVLRVVPETGRAAPGNPFIGKKGRNLIYSYGHRNPQGLDRRPCTNQMWAAEHGPSRDDEVNLIVPGGNYGWNPVPGYNEAVPMTDFRLPGPQRAAKWSSGVPTVAISGVGWIRGADWGAWDGDLAGATLKNQRLMIFEFKNRNGLQDVDIPRELLNDYGRLRTAVMGPDGSLYVTSDGASAVLRVTPEAGPTPGDQDIDGDGFDDLIVGAPAKAVGSRGAAGAFNSIYGGPTGLRPFQNGSELRTQAHINGTPAQTGDRLASSVAYGDVDGDGMTDVIVGSPGEDVRGRSNAGAVHIICGRTNGVARRSSQTFTQAGTVAGLLEAGNRFGAAVASGDFDGDGFDDVAVGAPNKGIGALGAAGSVTVMNGTSAGLTTENSQSWNQNTAGFSAGSGSRFGASLTVGDFDDDGFDDLAIGAPGRRVGGLSGSGSIVILYGSTTGLTATGSQEWTLANGVPGGNGAGDGLGSVLGAGDLDGDGVDDLVAGMPSKDVAGQANAGAIALLLGSGGGLSAAGATVTTQLDIGADNVAGDNFGGSVSVGDFNGDSTHDVVVGTPGENSGRGEIAVFLGAGGGPTFDQRFTAGGPVAGAAAPGNRFGATLRSGDFDGDGFDDLGIGSPGRDAPSAADSGSITVLEGSGSGLTATASRHITQASPGVKGVQSAGDAWGSAL